MKQDHYKNITHWNIDLGLIRTLPIVFLFGILLLNEDVLIPFLLLIFSIFCYCIAAYKYRFIFGFSGIRILSIPSIMIITFTFFIAFPSIYVISTVSDTAEIPYISSIILFYPLFCTGLLTANSLNKVNNNNLNNMIYQTITPSKNDTFFYNILINIFIFSIIFTIIYLFRVDDLPIIELIQNPGDNSKFFLLREEALKLLKITAIERYTFNWLRSLFIPFGVVGSLFLMSVYKKFKYKVMFILFLILGLFVNTVTLEKSPLAALVLSIFSFYFLKNLKIKISTIIASIFIVLLGPIIITYYIFIDNQNVFQLIFWSYIERLLVVPAKVLYHYFLHFPDTHSFLLGRSSQLFSWIHPEGTFPISNYIFKLWWNIRESTGSANANFLGNYWADFGWYGIIFSSFLLGVIIQVFTKYIFTSSNYEKNINYFVCSAISLPLFTFGFFSSNFTILFFTKGLIVLILILFLINNYKNH